MPHKKIPLKIELCPLIETVVDFRFETTIPHDAIFGIIYTSFKSSFSNQVEKLPILQIPEQIRMQDPNLVFQPYYRLKDSDFILQIGPRVISFVNLNNYIGWTAYYGRIKESIQKIRELDLALKFKRLGLRYINFFPFDLYNRITLSILMDGKPLPNKHLALRAVLATGNYQTNLNIMNNTNVLRNNRMQIGSIIDIDTYLEGESIDIFSDPDSLIGNAHAEEKQLFFDLLNDDLIQELRPIYGA